MCQGMARVAAMLQCGRMAEDEQQTTFAPTDVAVSVEAALRASCAAVEVPLNGAAAKRCGLAPPGPQSGHAALAIQPAAALSASWPVGSRRQESLTSASLKLLQYGNNAWKRPWPNWSVPSP